MGKKEGQKRGEGGITLIALVITIIILLLLSGISISMLSGDNGILTTAGTAKEETEKAAAYEAVQLEAIGALDNYGELDTDAASEGMTENLGATVEEYDGWLLVEYNGYNFIVYEDGDVEFWYGGSSEANSPELTSGMIPVKYDTDNEVWVICSEDDEEWYSYTTDEKKWANVMLSDGLYTTETAVVGTEVADEDLGSMFVWIPRYAYTITDGYHSTNGSIEIVWLIGTSYNYIDDDGELQKAENGNDDGITTNNGGYYVAHPAFTDGYESGTFDNGEWECDITGLWVAKFQAGFVTTEEDSERDVNTTEDTTGLYYPIFKGKSYGYNWITTGNCYSLSLALDDSGNPYGLSTAANSHLMKSSEWGAVAYLSISEYGYSGGTSSEDTEKYKNNLSLINYSYYTKSPVQNPNYTSSTYGITAITGYTATGGKTAQNYIYNSSVDTDWTISQLIDTVVGYSSLTSYAWNYTDSGSDSGSGTLSSTTGNIYGIYDMGGCLAEYTASYINEQSVSYLKTYGSSYATTGESTYLSTAYPADCDSNGYYDLNSSYDLFEDIFGDAIYETSAQAGSGYAWFGETVEADSASYSEPFFIRGGIWYGTATVGLCGLSDPSGRAAHHYGFRTVMAVE